MLMSLNRKGFSIIEGMICISLFSILFMCALSVEVARIKTHQYVEIREANIMYLEKLKSYIINNINYTSINNLYSSGKRYINTESINQDSSNFSDIIIMFDSDIHNVNNYIYLSITEGIPMKIVLEYHKVDSISKETITCEFYKGNYDKS